MKKIYLIEAWQKGNPKENHFRGPYKNKEDQEKRLQFLKKYIQKFKFKTIEINAESIDENRSILNGTRVVYNNAKLVPIEVNKNGMADFDLEYFSDRYFFD